MTSILSIRDLSVRFSTPEGEVKAVSDVSLDINKGECLGIVGESGSGKSQLFISIMGLLADNGQVDGTAKFQGDDLLKLPRRKLNKIRGDRMSMIFQDPMTCLTPHLTIAKQLTEVLKFHKGASEANARKRALELLDMVRIPEAANRIDMYPHEFSGGMRQRVMIAMGLLCEPELLIADEPSTALDVTVQAQIIDLLNELKRETGTAIIMITHDLGVVAGICDRVNVMYAGQFVETGTVQEIFYDPQHPYTRGLLGSMPRLDQIRDEHLTAIPGQPPNLQNLPAGCNFQERCTFAFDPCWQTDPPLEEFSPGRCKACFYQGFDNSQKGAAS
ncbi:MAG: ATP-binding cassette domain-containing protein [Alphaproteobacteria bacterium]|nr:MAG: ATP-binding cassette domain-containing protein [Alphaproteobacteria bacterium]